MSRALFLLQRALRDLEDVERLMKKKLTVVWHPRTPDGNTWMKGYTSKEACEVANPDCTAVKFVEEI